MYSFAEDGLKDEMQSPRVKQIVKRVLGHDVKRNNNNNERSEPPNVRRQVAHDARSKSASVQVHDDEVVDNDGGTQLCKNRVRW